LGARIPFGMNDMVGGCVGLLSHLYLHILNKTDVLGDVEGFKKLVNAGRCGRPLVTISNHQSIYDDPSVLAECVAPSACHSAESGMR
jgi:hypothetical protein